MQVPLHGAAQERYALKTVVKRSQEGEPSGARRALVFTERDAMKRLAGSPWHIGLKASFEDDDYFYFLMVSCLLLRAGLITDDEG